MGELAPFTLDGWYALHQVWVVDRAAAGGAAQAADALFERMAAPPEGGWSAAFRLVGGNGDVLAVHFRPTLDDLARAAQDVRRSCAGAALRLSWDFTSVTEAALYHATVEAARAGAARTPEYERQLEQLVAAERDAPRMALRLYPRIPSGMHYVSFYPMSKRRTHPDNWYLLPLEQRSELMAEHGHTGRRFAGRICQVITGATGLADWEWGVTLFAHDPLEIKRVVTEMRYDVATARYAEFGPFVTGIRLDADGWADLLDVR